MFTDEAFTPSDAPASCEAHMPNTADANAHKASQLPSDQSLPRIAKVPSRVCAAKPSAPAATAGECIRRAFASALMCTEIFAISLNTSDGLAADELRDTFRSSQN